MLPTNDLSVVLQIKTGSVYYFFYQREGAFIYFWLLRFRKFKRRGPLFEALRYMASSNLISYPDTLILIILKVF